MQTIKLKTKGFIAEYTAGSHIVIKYLDKLVKDELKLIIYKPGEYKLANSEDSNIPVMMLKINRTMFINPSVLQGLYKASLEGIAILNQEGGLLIDPSKINMIKEPIKSNYTKQIIPQNNLKFGSVYINKARESKFYFGNCFVYKLDNKSMTYIKQSKQFPSNYFIYADSEVLKYIKGCHTNILTYPKAKLKLTYMNVTPHNIIEDGLVRSYRTEKQFLERYTVDIIPDDTTILQITASEIKYLFIRKFHNDMQLPHKIKLNHLTDNIIDKIYNIMFD